MRAVAVSEIMLHMLPQPMLLDTYLMTCKMRNKQPAAFSWCAEAHNRRKERMHVAAAPTPFSSTNSLTHTRVVAS